MEGGKVVLVTGASSGLGREFAIALAEEGFRVLVAARRTQLLKSLCEEIENIHGVSGGGIAIKLDVSAGEASIDSDIERAWNSFGRIDVLVNNAGIRGTVKSPLELDEEEWNAVMNTNARGTWLVTKCVGNRMKKNLKGGSIINISSTAGVERGLLPGAIAYGSSKAAINQMTKVMALELGKYNIRVNAIAAGLFRSEITNNLFDQQWLKDSAARIVPLQRFGETKPDLTSLLVMLAKQDSESSYITGNIFLVDGGQSLPGIPLWSSL